MPAKRKMATTIISGNILRQISTALEVRNPDLELEILNSKEASAYPSLSPINGNERNTALRSYSDNVSALGRIGQGKKNRVLTRVPFLVGDVSCSLDDECFFFSEHNAQTTSNSQARAIKPEPILSNVFIVSTEVLLCVFRSATITKAIAVAARRWY